MSLVHSCELNGANPFDYLTELQRRAEELHRQPAAWMMIPHHQGAIDMAKAELLYGKDPLMRRLAEEIVVDQQSEIQAMQLWLSKQPTTTPEGRK